MKIEELSDISDYPNWLEITPIELGSSGESKYHILRTDGKELILRVSDIHNYKRHCNSALFAQYIHNSLDINMNVPVETAACCNDTLAYTLYTWVEGDIAESVLPELHTPDQAQYGEKAGRLLKRIHSVAAPDKLPAWEYYFGNKIDKTLFYYNYIEVSFPGDKKMISFIENNRRLLEGRPRTALHGDFRPENLVIDSRGEFGVIDFDKWCWGDPYMDFQTIRRTGSQPFSRGQILGYFEGTVPGDFFALMALYIAVYTLKRICRVYTKERERVPELLAEAERTVKEFNEFEGLVPTWY